MVHKMLAALVLLWAILLQPTCGSRSTASTTAGHPASAGSASVASASASAPNGNVGARGLGPAAVTGVQEYAVPRGSGPHDVAPAPDGSVWFTAQAAGALGRLKPATGETLMVNLGAGSAPHGVIIGPDGAPWVTDGGLNAIVRVDPGSGDVRTFPLPASRPRVGLNTAAFDPRGTLWFTGEAGVYGRLDPSTGDMKVFDAPRGPEP